MKKIDPGPPLKEESVSFEDIEHLALDALKSVRLLPECPGPVAVEKFCDRRWGSPEDYQEMPVDVMGFSSFTCNGFERIVINTELEKDYSAKGHQLVRSTLAHEIGHAILHERLFVEKLVFERDQGTLFPEMKRKAPEVAFICRSSDIFGEEERSKWWEVQANTFMAFLLLPKPLFCQVVEPLLSNFERAVRAVSDTFNVSQILARIAVDKFLESSQAEREDLI